METKRHSRTSRLITAAVLVLLTFLFSGCATRSSYSPAAAPIFDKLIVPGKRIGPIALGMPQADVLNILGKPPKSIIHTDGHSSYFYADLLVFISNNSRVYRVNTTAPEYSTADGIRVGMTEPEVRAKRGKPKRVFNLGDNAVTYWYESKLEIWFDRSTGNRITSICIED